MSPKKEKSMESSLQEILEGVDAVGTIASEDLGLLRKQFLEMQEAISKVRDDIKILSLNQKGIEDSQQEILETLKFLTDKLNRIEIKVIEGIHAMPSGDLSETD